MPSKVSRREAIRDAEQTDVPQLSLLAIRGNSCWRCLEHNNELRTCTGCERAVYCSTECQLADWHIVHKQHCKAFQLVNATEHESSEETTWSAYKSALHSKAQLAKSNTADHQLGDLVQAVIGQPHCSSCHRTGTQLGSNAYLESCKTCRLVSTCGDCEPKHTEEECQYYSLVAELEEYKLSHFEAHSTVCASVTPTKAKRSGLSPSLSSLGGWLDYYRWISDKRNISSFIAADFSFGVTDQELDVPTARERWRHLLLTTDSLTMPMTILAALEDSIPDLLFMDTLSLHIVGAAGKEFRSLKIFEEILHLLPTVRHLKVLLVGPESPGSSAGQTGEHGQDIELDCCSTCTTERRRRTVTSFQGGYHEYATKPAYTKPDLAILFHSGRSQAYVEEWKPTTRFLVESGTRTLCTTYTEREAREETAELDGLGVRFIVRPEVNKWRGLAPLPELLEGPEHCAYYNNYYQYIFQADVK